MSPAPLDHKPYHHGDLKRALAEAARRILEDEGLAGLTLRAVAREAGVSPAAPYHHFKDRNELLSAVAEEGTAELLAALIRARDASRPGRSRMVAVGSAYVQYGIDNPALYRLMFETIRVLEVSPPTLDPQDTIPVILMEAFSEAMPADMGENDRRLAGIAGWAALRGLTDIVRYPQLDALKGVFGGDTGFIRAVLEHLSFGR
jgi:AcrR family transcriptional regulator